MPDFDFGSRIRERLTCFLILVKPSRLAHELFGLSRYVSRHAGRATRRHDLRCRASATPLQSGLAVIFGLNHFLFQ